MESNYNRLKKSEVLFEYKKYEVNKQGWLQILRIVYTFHNNVIFNALVSLLVKKYFSEWSQQFCQFYFSLFC